MRDEPHMRWFIGTPEPVPYAEVRDALATLDLWEATANKQAME